MAIINKIILVFIYLWNDVFKVIGPSCMDTPTFVLLQIESLWILIWIYPCFLQLKQLICWCFDAEWHRQKQTELAYAACNWNIYILIVVAIYELRTCLTAIVLRTLAFTIMTWILLLETCIKLWRSCAVTRNALLIILPNPIIICAQFPILLKSQIKGSFGNNMKKKNNGFLWEVGK